MMSKSGHSAEEAQWILGVGESELKDLRKKVGISGHGRLSQANISAMKSYLEATETQQYQQSCSPLGEYEGVCDEEIKEKADEDQKETYEAPISKKHAKELVLEAYELGVEHGKELGFVNDSVGMLELLGAAQCQQQTS
jgi:hypothetical protein